jgi:HD superfamily phosphohydrolase
MDLYGRPEHESKVFTLPSAGSVHLYGPEMELVRTPEFQRLGGIKQLGTSYVVFRGATHTRFEHSLGTVHQVERLIQAVNRNPANPTKINARPHRLARLFALLHDITHVPFGHTLEDELRLLQRHDENAPRLERLVLQSEVGEILQRTLGGDFDEFVGLMRAKSDEEIATLTFPYVADLVGNTVCADLLDYVQRDLEACGMPVALGERFLDFFTITTDTLLKTDKSRMALNLDKRRMPRPDVESEVIKLLSYRYELAERVYFHHAKNAASVMIGRAVRAAGLVGEETPPKDDSHFDWLSDEILLRALESPALAGAMRLRQGRRPSKTKLKLATKLAEAVRKRSLYKIAYLGVRDDLADAVDGLYGAHKEPAARTELEDSLARQAGVERGQVLVHLPSPDMLLKPAVVRVVTSEGRVVSLQSWDDRHSGRTRAINRAHERLWRVTVYVDPALNESRRALVRAAAETRFGASSRYVEPSKLTPYLEMVFDQHADDRGWNPDEKRVLEQEFAARAKALPLDRVVEQIDGAVRLLRETAGETTEAAS